MGRDSGGRMFVTGAHKTATFSSFIYGLPFNRNPAPFEWSTRRVTSQAFPAEMASPSSCFEFFT